MRFAFQWFEIWFLLPSNLLRFDEVLAPIPLGNQVPRIQALLRVGLTRRDRETIGDKLQLPFGFPVLEFYFTL